MSIEEKKKKVATLLYETLKIEPHEIVIICGSIKGCTVSWNSLLINLIFMGKVLDREINK